MPATIDTADAAAIPDTSPAVTRAIAALTPIPPGAVSLGAFAHPSRPEIAGQLVRFAATRVYAIASGRTLTSVPRAWARRQLAALQTEAAHVS